MKAVVLEINKNKAVVLSDGGMVKEVMNKNYETGQTIEMERKIMSKMNKKYRKIAAGIAASLVIMLGGGTAYAYNTPVAHVSLDVNPGMTFSVNAFDRVIDVEMATKEAEGILLEIDWDGKNINNVIKDTISALKEENYLENEEWYSDSLMITVNATSPKKEGQLIQGIKNELTNVASEDTDKEIDVADLNEVVIGIGAQRVADAATISEHLDSPVTAGKLNLVQKLYASELGNQESTSAEAVEWINSTQGAVWLEGSVKDIMAKIKQNRFEQREMTSEGIDADLDEYDPGKKSNGIINSTSDGNINTKSNGKNNSN